MNKTAALIALTLAAGVAQACDIDPTVNAAMFAPSTRTRADVVAELLKARSGGQPVVTALVQIDMGEQGAERRLATAVQGEDSGSFYLAQVAGKKAVKR